MAYSLKFLPQRDGVVITKSDYPVDGVGEQQRFPHGALSLRYSTTSDAPSGQVEVVRLSDDAAVGVFNVTTGSVDGVDHDGDISVLLLAAMTAINGKGYELESGGTGLCGCYGLGRERVAECTICAYAGRALGCWCKLCERKRIFYYFLFFCAICSALFCFSRCDGHAND